MKTSFLYKIHCFKQHTKSYTYKKRLPSTKKLSIYITALSMYFFAHPVRFVSEVREVTQQIHSPMPLHPFDPSATNVWETQHSRPAEGNPVYLVAQKTYRLKPAAILVIQLSRTKSGTRNTNTIYENL
jgi:hypothetical protein